MTGGQANAVLCTLTKTKPRYKHGLTDVLERERLLPWN
jgi:hypothetical protein